jgi:hypothetical protein
LGFTRYCRALGDQCSSDESGGQQPQAERFGCSEWAAKAREEDITLQCTEDQYSETFMRSVLISLVLIFSSTFVSADVFEDLKQQPSTKYDLGLIRLEIGAVELTRRLNGTSIKGTSFDIKDVSADEFDHKVALVVSLAGKAKDMKQEFCRSFVDKLKEGINFDSLSREIWRDLSDDQYAALKDLFVLKVKLISKENEAFEISCD